MAAPRTRSPNQLLLSAARAGNGAAVIQALSAGAIPSFKNTHGETAVRLACAAPSPSALTALLAVGASPIDDLPALTALLEHHPAVFERLMAQHPSRFSPHLGLVHLAAAREHLSVVANWPSSRPKDARLIWGMAVADERPVPQAGLDALWERFPLAPQHPLYEKMVDDGIRRGLLPQKVRAALTAAETLQDMKGRAGESRLRTAVARGHTLLVQGFVDRLKKEGVDVPDELCKELCFLAAPHASRLLLEAVSSLKGWDEKSWATLRHGQSTLLHEVLSANAHPSRRLAFVRLLITHGADVNAPGLAGMTPLHQAAQTARWDRKRGPTVLDILDAAGASWEAVALDGKRPFDVLRHGALADHWRGVLATRDLEAALPSASASPQALRPRF